MSIPRDYKWRQGDRVSLIGEIVFDHQFSRDGGETVCVEIVGGCGQQPHLWVKTEAMDLTEACFKIGDTVRDKDAPNLIGRVVGLHGTWAWIELASGGQPVGKRTFDLERLPEPVEAARAA